MANRNFSIGMLFAVAAITLGCAGNEFRAPTAPTPPPPAPAPPAGIAGVFPPISAPGRLYLGTSAPVVPIHGGPLYSRYVLYDDKSFALQYSSARYPFFEYKGTYAESGSALTFTWEGWSTAGPWGSTGTLEGDTLTVKYNLIMQLTDFEDGTYVRVPE